MDESVSGYFKALKQNIDLEEKNVDDALEIFKPQIDTGTDGDKDRFAILIHLIMVQNDFCFSLKSANEANNQTQLKESFEMNQTKGNMFNKINYNCFGIMNFKNEKKLFELESNLIISILKTGKEIGVHCKYQSFNSQFLKFNLNDYFSSGKTAPRVVFNFNKRLKVEFTNKILIPLKQFLKPNFFIGLTDLPNELLIYRIMLKYLNIKDIMSLDLTCKYFYGILNSGDQTSDKSIWFRLLQRDFKSKFENEVLLEPSGSIVDYKKMYIKFYQAKRYKRKYLYF